MRPRYAIGVVEPKRGSDPAGDFAEIWGSERRNASYLRVVTGALLVMLLALSTGWCRSASRTLQPVFVRVDEVGRAEALDYEALTWQNDPLQPSTKYFLRQFATDHYSRRFATVAERWPHLLAFLERTLAAASAEAHQEEIAEFSAPGWSARSVPWKTSCCACSHGPRKPTRRWPTTTSCAA